MEKSRVREGKRTILQGEHLTLTYWDGAPTIDAVHNVSVAVEDRQFIGILSEILGGADRVIALRNGRIAKAEGQLAYAVHSVSQGNVL